MEGKGGYGVAMVTVAMEGKGLDSLEMKGVSASNHTSNKKRHLDACLIAFLPFASISGLARSLERTYLRSFLL